MKTILITGAAGFIGSHTVDHLLAHSDARVIAVDDFRTGHVGNLRLALKHSRFQLERSDLGENDTIARLCRLHRPDAIIHLAGLVSVGRAEQEPTLNFTLNLENTHRVAEAARTNGVHRIVFASSAACYGESTASPLSENTATVPISMYGTAKLASEQLLAGYASSYGIDTVCLRYFNVYGDRQDPASPYSGVISRFSKAFADGQAVTLFGDGTQTRDFIAVEDVARANAISATAAAISPGVRNICTGQGRSLLDVLEIFRALHPQSPAARFADARQGDIHDSCGDPEKAKRELGFCSSISLDDGLRRLIVRNRRPLLRA